MRRIVLGVALALVVIGVLLNVITGQYITFAMVFAAAPILVSPVLSARGTALVAVVAVSTYMAVVFWPGAAGRTEDAIRVALVGALSMLAVGINYIVRRSSEELASVRSVAEAAQRALLPEPPVRMEGLEIAARYQAARLEAEIGGDLYAVQKSPYGVRMLVGDARGKGLGAISVVAVAIGAFRETAENETALTGIADRMEKALLREAELRGEAEEPESFMTVVLAEIPRGEEGVLRIVNRGHPPPLLRLADGSVRCLEPSEPALPLGMGDLAGAALPESTGHAAVAFPAGSQLLLYTDGVSEARDADGVFYDPEELLRGRFFPGPGELLDALLDDVNEHTGGAVTDDMALLAVQRRAESAT